MLSFASEQIIVDIAGTRLGGRMGELPTVLMGSMFQKKHYIVSDPMKGFFDHAAAKSLLDREKQLSEETGNPRMVDVVADTSDAMVRYLDFIVDNTETPFLLDSPSAKVRMAGVRFLAKEGGLNRAIYNSIDPSSEQDEFACLSESGVSNVMILAFGTKYLRPRDRVRLLTGDENGSGAVGLVDLVKNTGARNILVDPGVLDMPSSSWTAKAIFDVKDRIGYPAGCAPSNALYTWLRSRDMVSPQIEACGGGVFSMPVYYGADFLLYGPVQNAEWVYPAIGVADAMIAYWGSRNGIKCLTKEHPLYKMF